MQTLSLYFKLGEKSWEHQKGDVTMETINYKIGVLEEEMKSIILKMHEQNFKNTQWSENKETQKFVIV